MSSHDQKAGLDRQVARLAAWAADAGGQVVRVDAELAGSALAADGRRLVVLEDGEVDHRLVRDMVEVLTWFCARLCGRRSAQSRALKVVGCAQRDIGLQAVVGARRQDAHVAGEAGA